MKDLVTGFAVLMLMGILPAGLLLIGRAIKDISIDGFPNKKWAHPVAGWLLNIFCIGVGLGMVLIGLWIVGGLFNTLAECKQ